MIPDSRKAAHEFCRNWLQIDPNKNPDIVMAFIRGANWATDQEINKCAKNPQYNAKTYERALHYHCCTYMNGLQTMSELVQHFKHIVEIATESVQEQQEREEQERKRFAIVQPEPKTKKREFVQLKLF